MDFKFRKRRPIDHLHLEATEAGNESAKGKGALRYYVYLSATKIEMIYPQIPPAFLKGAEAEFKVNLGVISTGLKARGPEESKELPLRVSAIESYLRNQKEVGTVNNPKMWIGGVASMRWGCVREYASDIAFFGGLDGFKTVALLGSSNSIIGAPKQSESNHAPFYYTMRFFNEMLENTRIKIEDSGSSGNENHEGAPPYYSYSKSVNIAFRALEGTDRRLEFLALVLHEEKELIVATPLYVALAS